MNLQRPQRWPRFRLRTLLLVVIPLAAAIVSFSIRYEKAARQRQIVDWIINDQRGHAYYDFGWSPSWTKEHPAPPGPRWAREWLGIDFLSDVHSVILDNQEIDDLSPLFELPELKTIAIQIEMRPSADLRSLAKLKRLEGLAIDLGRVAQSDIDFLAEALPNCEISLGEGVWLE